ncbi:hypothetical protein ACA910_002733 [Epithemia clementina (nom. ined.)]
MERSLKSVLGDFSSKNPALPNFSFSSSSRAPASNASGLASSNMGFVRPASDESEDEEDEILAKGVAKKAKKTKTKHKTRKVVKKKPGDMPRRPLSAYNYFFSEMRTKLVSDRASGKDEGFKEFLAKQGAGTDGSKKNGFFSSMGKYVAKRWKELSPEEMKPFTDKADEDLERYRREMDEYREGVARKTRLASEKKLLEQDSTKGAKEPETKKQAKPPPPSPPRATAATTSLAPSNNATASNDGPTQSSVTSSQQLLQAAVPSQQFPAQASGQYSLMQQAGLDPTYQFLLRQQLLQGTNPQLNSQLNSLLLQQQQLVSSQLSSAGMGGGHQVQGYGQMFGQTDIGNRQSDHFSLGMTMHQLQNPSSLLADTSHMNPVGAHTGNTLENHYNQFHGQPMSAGQVQLDGQSLGGYSLVGGQGGGDHQLTGQLQLNQSFFGQQLANQTPYGMLGLQTQSGPPSNSSAPRGLPNGFHAGSYM